MIVSSVFGSRRVATKLQNKKTRLFIKNSLVFYRILFHTHTTSNAEIAVNIASKLLNTAYPTATLPVPPTSNQRTASIRMANRSNIVYLRKLSCNSLLGDGIRLIWRIVSAINASLSFTCGALARKRFFIVLLVIICVLYLSSISKKMLNPKALAGVDASAMLLKQVV